MRRLFSILRLVVRKILSRLRRFRDRRETRRIQAPFIGNLEGLHIADDTIRGWVFDERAPRATGLQVGLYAQGALLDVVTVEQPRADVAAHHGCALGCGFAFPLSEALIAPIRQAGGVVSVCIVGPEPREIGQLGLMVQSGPDTDPVDLTALIARFLSEDLADIDAMLEAPVPEPFSEGVPDLVPHKALFETRPLVPVADCVPSGLPAYQEFTRHRNRVEEEFQVVPDSSERDRFLYFYLTTYNATRRQRVPLSAADIAYLNATLSMGGARQRLTRMMWWRLAQRRDLLAELDLNDCGSYTRLVFWWAWQDAAHLGVEDCLVTDSMADLLRSIAPSRQFDDWPLTTFAERVFNASVALHFLAPGRSAESRKELYLILLVRALKRPDLLRYMPRRLCDALLLPVESGGRSELETFLARVTGRNSVAFARERYAHALREKGFDLESLRFLTLTEDGHRLEAAALPVPKGALADIQLIGPLAKASGLGQAARLSASILAQTGTHLRCVDFDMDNPAPEGFSTDGTLIESYGPARINLIHLNAESVPLAFAYQPDVFSHSYNIGYFYWELDRPAACHYLALQMLDEIWLSSDYGVQIYRPHFDGPIRNVGMCFEPNDDIDRQSARRFVERRFRLSGKHFVCLVAFDSFSFVQRKNPLNALRSFQKAFEGVPEARLIVKTQNRHSVFDPVQIRIWDEMEAIMSRDPRILLMNETLSYRDLLRLKKGADCYLSLHRSEGWGFGMIEAMSLGVPVVCSAYSGNLEFCTEDTAWLVPCTEAALSKGDYIFTPKGAVWAEPDVETAARLLRQVYEDPAARERKTAYALDFIRTHFSTTPIAARYKVRLEQILDQLDHPSREAAE
ncbi:glycosyltransferase (plasmid) [Thioclava sp. 'Guangxiensis']|uniref:glycosyltransferase n=1 Tax=Thioclava sp. 'Guangxiensis' TaxID=3149044 RepID=UPI0032C4901B